MMARSRRHATRSTRATMLGAGTLLCVVAIAVPTRAAVLDGPPPAAPASQLTVSSTPPAPAAGGGGGGGGAGQGLPAGQTTIAPLTSAANPATAPGVGGPGLAAAKAKPAPASTLGRAVKLDPRQIVVKLRPGVGVSTINASYGTTTASVLLQSRSIYLLRAPADPVAEIAAKDDRDGDKGDKRDEKDQKGKDHEKGKGKGAAKAVERLAQAIARDERVAYAEVNRATDSTEDERFHHWPNGGPTCNGGDPRPYAGQPAVATLDLPAAHAVATGAGGVVAVLDTGLTLTHPALAHRLARGSYDYVGDDHDPGEVDDGVDQDNDGRVDEGYGHGTFVAGIVALVAPDARIMPMRVLDSEGRGNVFVVAEAIFDAVDAGADVVNLSFGTASEVNSALLSEALSAATGSGVVVTAAAGNDGSGNPHYPAASAGVVSVAATDATERSLAAFSARGDWVDLAAPGVDITSTLPCGYGSWSGTSMATPFVSGAAALLSERWGTSHKSEPAKRLLSCADKVHGVKVHSGVMDVRRCLRH
jgi:subtilisin family serine protease